MVTLCFICEAGTTAKVAEYRDDWHLSHRIAHIDVFVFICENVEMWLKIRHCKTRKHMIYERLCNPILSVFEILIGIRSMKALTERFAVRSKHIGALFMFML